VNRYKSHSKAHEYQKGNGQRIRGCVLKKEYETREDAELNCPSNQTVYKCSHCDKFHRATEGFNKYKIFRNSRRSRGKEG
jgi:hypothetical protein